MTKQRGFDPNVWFGNVENMAAEKIGAETVPTSAISISITSPIG